VKKFFALFLKGHNLKGGGRGTKLCQTKLVRDISGSLKVSISVQFRKTNSKYGNTPGKARKFRN
jgi:hypothetical protein